MMKFKSGIAAFLFFVLFTACHQGEPQDTENRQPVRVAISKATPLTSYKNYIRWIKYADSTVEYIDMYSLELDSALLVLNTCDGLILTGGTDIYPGRYGKENDTARCWKTDFKRDTLESMLLFAAMGEKIPIMGICRGLQMINVEMGGTMYIDLPTDLDTLVDHQVPGSYDATHSINIKENSLLHSISEVTAGTTNSNHHQGIEILAPALEAIAWSSDGLIEAIQLDDDSERYLLGVQWHPERMDYSTPLSGKLAKRFIKEVHRFSRNKNNK